MTMRMVTALLVILMVPLTGLAQRGEGGTTAVPVAPVDVERPLQRAVLREAERIARTAGPAVSQAPQKARHAHPVLIGAAIGAGAGLLLNATACNTGESICSGPGNLLMAAIGAGIGAAIGALVSR